VSGPGTVSAVSIPTATEPEEVSVPPTHADDLADELVVPGDVRDLTLALRKLRTVLVITRYPLLLPNAEEA
jgi:hypothetical protein